MTRIGAIPELSVTGAAYSIDAYAGAEPLTEKLTEALVAGPEVEFLVSSCPMLLAQFSHEV
jgi:hypothetical protein